MFRTAAVVFAAALIAGCCCPKKCDRDEKGPGQRTIRAPDEPGLYVFDGEALTSFSTGSFSLTTTGFGSFREHEGFTLFKERELKAEDLLKGQHPLYIMPKGGGSRAFYFDGEVVSPLRNYRVERDDDGKLKLIPEPRADPEAEPEVIPLKK